MNAQTILPLSDPNATLENVGGKGMSLAKLSRAGLPVPDGFHITTHAYRRFVAENELQPRLLAALAGADPANPASLEAASQAIRSLFAQGAMPPETAEAISAAYAALGEVPVAVRSSATAEDLPGASFAGQQDTYLNLLGNSAVLEGVQKCWGSLWTARAIAYRARQQISPEQVALAVVVQALVPADAAGVLFTANPINGNRGEMVLTAAWGLGEALVSGAVTPDTLTIEKSTARLLRRETNDKQVMTVRTDSGTQEQPAPAHLRQCAVLEDAQAAELARLGRQIENLYGMPMDIEWTLADGKFAIVQARPITALPEAQAAPLEWKPPHPKGIYMRGSVVDLMPDPLSTLFASIGPPSIISGTAKVFKDFLRSDAVLAEDYFTTINGYAYMNSYMPPKSLWWALTKMLPGYPRILREGIPFWREQVLPMYRATAARWQARPPQELTPAELWQGAQEVMQAAMIHLGSLMIATMGASAGSEGLVTWVYNKMLRQDGDPDASILLMGFDTAPIRADKALYDLADWARSRPALASYLLDTPDGHLAIHAVQAGGEAPAGQPDDWAEFQSRLRAYLAEFGHMIYDMDIAKPLPLDDPAPMLNTVKMYLRGAGNNPHERQHTAAGLRQQTTEAMLKRVRGWKGWAFRKALNWAVTLGEVREEALAAIGLGYPALRSLLSELGQRFVQANVITQASDIFWLNQEEISDLVAHSSDSQPASLPDLRGRVQERLASWKQAKASTPPPMIPYKKRVMGIKTDSFLAISESEQTEGTLKGIPTSAGQVTAPARVLHGAEDFSLMQPGEVLVAAITTPAWTPLFAMAAAVVTDVGGPLSHGSIVAREYGIPAVMGTGVGSRRIRSGQIITVDGSAGTITLHGKDQ